MWLPIGELLVSKWLIRLIANTVHMLVEVLGRAHNISPTTIITQLYSGVWCWKGVSLLL